MLALTLGIGLTTTMFSIVYGALMKGLPYPDGDRIMIINASNPPRGINQSGISDSRLRRLQGAAARFTDLAAITSGTIYVSGDEKAERFDGSWITANTFDILGVQPMLGRNFRAGEDTPPGEKVAILVVLARGTSGTAATRTSSASVIRVNGVPYDRRRRDAGGFRVSEQRQDLAPAADGSARDEARRTVRICRSSVSSSPACRSIRQTSTSRRSRNDSPRRIQEANEGFTSPTCAVHRQLHRASSRANCCTRCSAPCSSCCSSRAPTSRTCCSTARRIARRKSAFAPRSARHAAAVVRQFLAESLVLSLVATVFGIVVA